MCPVIQVAGALCFFCDLLLALKNEFVVGRREYVLSSQMTADEI